MLISIVFGPFTFVARERAAWRILVRFVRISLSLCIPLLEQPAFARCFVRLLNRGNRQLVVVSELHTCVSYLNIWVIRPFQGIGISLFLITRLLSLLTIWGGGSSATQSYLPAGQFSLERFTAALGISALVLLLLTFLWSVDDLGVLHFNQATGEVRMVGKYVGIVMPTLFGFLGFSCMLEQMPKAPGALYIVELVAIFYPPFVVLSILHAGYLAQRQQMILKALRVRLSHDDSDNSKTNRTDIIRRFKPRCLFNNLSLHW